jgi:hypothetical protein
MFLFFIFFILGINRVVVTTCSSMSGILRFFWVLLGERLHHMQNWGLFNFFPQCFYHSIELVFLWLENIQDCRPISLVWDNLLTFFSGSHNFMVTALALCVKWPWRIGHMAQLWCRVVVFSQWGGKAIGWKVVHHIRKSCCSQGKPPHKLHDAIKIKSSLTPTLV